MLRKHLETLAKVRRYTGWQVWQIPSLKTPEQGAGASLGRTEHPKQISCKLHDTAHPSQAPHPALPWWVTDRQEDSHLPAGVTVSLWTNLTFHVCCDHLSCSNVLPLISPSPCLFSVFWSSPLISHSVSFLSSLLPSSTLSLEQKGIISQFPVLLLVMPLVNHCNCKEEHTHIICEFGLQTWLSDRNTYYIKWIYRN